jgi:hypothetical protein
MLRIHAQISVCLLFVATICQACHYKEQIKIMHKISFSCLVHTNCSIHVCGRYIANQNDIEEWLKQKQRIVKILNEGKSKLVTSFRLQVFRECQFQRIDLLNAVSNEGASYQQHWFLQIFHPFSSIRRFQLDVCLQ